MRIKPLPVSEYERRVRRVQEELEADDIDLMVGYSSECESSTVRYLSGFWPFFDFACVLVPARGEAALVTGGPESLQFAKSFSALRNIRVNPLLVETSAPEWVPQVTEEDFAKIVPEIAGSALKRIGVVNWNIFPHVLLQDLRKAAPKAEIVPCDDLLLRVQSVKSEAEIPYIVEAYRITEEAMKAALEAAEPGRAEWELEAVARSKMVLSGAEGMGYPAWVCSGPNTVQSLCRSSDRRVQTGELIQFTFGAKYMGYCGNMCRPLCIGSMPAEAEKLVRAALEASEYALKAIRPGVRASDVFAGYHDLLSGYGYEEFTLYGPAHGTGHSEVEGMWLSENAEFTIVPNMLFNIDVWLSDGTHGLRLEDGVLVTDEGLRELTSFRREVIVL